MVASRGVDENFSLYFVTKSFNDGQLAKNPDNQARDEGRLEERNKLAIALFKAYLSDIGNRSLLQLVVCKLEGEGRFPFVVKEEPAHGFKSD